jgi:thymidylate synthase (FAD)
VMALPDNGYIRVLDHGWVGLVDWMGNDQRVVDAARLSISGEGVKATSTVEGLIRYLLRNRHTTPFEKVVFELDIKMPIFVARQMVRHRTQALNELSARYSVLPDEFYVPAEAQIQYQADKNKQGRKDAIMADSETLRNDFSNEATVAFSVYNDRIESGMARELARINLPLSTYTRWWTTISLHNLMHLLSLRMNPHAQWEIVEFANAMAEFVKQVCPITWEAFEDFRLNAMTLTAQDIEAIQRYMSNYDPESVGDLFKTTREFEEFEAKWAQLSKVAS